MKLPTSGAFVDHNGDKVQYRLRMELAGKMTGWWHCEIAEQDGEGWHAAGFGRTHSEAMKSAREWKAQVDA